MTNTSLVSLVWAAGSECYYLHTRIAQPRHYRHYYHILTSMNFISNIPTPGWRLAWVGTILIRLLKTTGNWSLVYERLWIYTQCTGSFKCAPLHVALYCCKNLNRNVFLLFIKIVRLMSYLRYSAVLQNLYEDMEVNKIPHIFNRQISSRSWRLIIWNIPYQAVGIYYVYMCQTV